MAAGPYKLSQNRATPCCGNTSTECVCLVSASLGQNPPPTRSLCPGLPLPQPTISTNPHAPSPPPLHNFNNQMLSGTCIQYPPFWVKTPHLCPISVPWPPISSTHYLCWLICPLCTPLFTISMARWYWVHALGICLFGLKTLHPRMIRVPHGYGNTRSVSITGNAVTGTVLYFGTPRTPRTRTAVSWVFTG